MTRQGGCACGAIRFQVTAPLLSVGACHCTDCQKGSGGGPNYVAVATAESFEVTQGSAKSFSTVGDSGAPATRFFCADCGTPLWSQPDFIPIRPIKIAAFDDAADLIPTSHIYMDSAPDWHLVSDEAMVFPKMPPPPA